MRVIAGSAKGTGLRAPPGRRTRPTPDRVREALFSSIAAELPDAVVLDLFAGSGALGIEALSRGADCAVFVEADRRAARIIKANLAATRLQAHARVAQADAYKLPAAPALLGGVAGFNVVFCDPPYDEPVARVSDLLLRLHDTGLLSAGALVVVERARRDPDLHRGVPDVFDQIGDRAYGDVHLRFLRVAE